jgi:peptidoglycan/xylan/chitin deacetylase (PgdA/CDA1 family)
MLHRVGPLSEDVFSPNADMSVSVEFLEEFIDSARARGYRFVSLDQLCELIEMGSDRKFLALTFDDGYRDNFITAYPLLKRLEIPFTIYVTTAFPDGDAVLWWYALEQMLQSQNFVKLADGRELLTRTNEDKLRAFVLLRQLMMKLPSHGLGNALNEMFYQKYFDWRQICLSEAVSWHDLRELALDPKVTIGAHTVSHPVLSTLSAEQASIEMRNSRDRIEAMTGATVSHFCYPFGSREEVGRREFELAQKLGFKTATTTRWGNIFRAHRMHLHGLPRVPLTNAFCWEGFRQQSLKRFWRGRVVSA